MTNCTCIDCMYGGNVGNESGGIALPSKEKGDGEMRVAGGAGSSVFGLGAHRPMDSEMRTMDDMLRDPENGNGYAMPGDIKRAIGSGGSLGFSDGIESWIVARLHYTLYIVKSGTKERYAKTKEKALQIASGVLDCDGKVEIKRIELN